MSDSEDSDEMDSDEEESDEEDSDEKESDEEESDEEDEEESAEEYSDEEDFLMEDSDVEDEEVVNVEKDIKFRFKMKNSIISLAEDDIRMKTVKRNSSKFAIESFQDYQEKLKAMDALSKYIAEIAHVEYKLSYCRQPPFDIFESFVFKTTKTFLKVTIDKEFQFQVENHHHERKFQVLTKKQLRFLVNHLDIENLRLSFKSEHRSCLSDCVTIVEAWQKGTILHNLKEMSIKSRHWSKENEVKLQEDGTLALVQTETNREFPKFEGTIKRFWDGKEAKVVVENKDEKKKPGPLRRELPTTPIVCGFFEMTVEKSFRH